MNAATSARRSTASACSQSRRRRSSRPPHRGQLSRARVAPAAHSRSSLDPKQPIIAARSPQLPDVARVQLLSPRAATAFLVQPLTILSLHSHPSPHHAAAAQEVVPPHARALGDVHRRHSLRWSFRSPAAPPRSSLTRGRRSRSRATIGIARGSQQVRRVAMGTSTFARSPWHTILGVGTVALSLEYQL